MRVAILGNSGSGKTTFAQTLAHSAAGVAVLDLDTIVWTPGQIAVRRPDEAIRADLESLCAPRDAWIIEGCYGDVIEAALRWRPELVFLNPGEEACLRNCRSRPWEPHKYASKAQQDEKLAFLLEWVREYYRRDGDLSLRGHRRVFDRYDGPKREVGAA